MNVVIVPTYLNGVTFQFFTTPPRYSNNLFSIDLSINFALFLVLNVICK